MTGQPFCHASMPLALYLHIPFCRQRCSYCAFNTYTGLESMVPAYVDALCRELEGVGKTGGRPEAHTIYFGGGTPSTLSAEAIARILKQIESAFTLVGSPEVTLEANPGAVTEVYLGDLRAAGVNRLSFGAQSAQEADLRLFKRDHGWEGVVASMLIARRAGFENVSLDLIYGAPGQTLAGWQETLARTADLVPEHISLYSLGVEPGTAMNTWIERGTVVVPDADLAADMYEYAEVTLADQGFEQYEISNWARPGHACRHNLQYWLREPYLGFGAGAHGFSGGIRYAVIKSPWEYVRRMSTVQVEQPFPLSPAVDAETIEPIDEAEARAEVMMLTLRLTQEGLFRDDFAGKFGASVEVFYEKQLKELASVGLIEVLPDRVRLTPRGRLLGNRVFSSFV